MRGMTVSVLAGLAALGAGAAGWDGAYLGGRTAEDKCFYAAGETMTFRLQVGGIAELPAGSWTIAWTRTGDDGVTQSGTAPVSLSAPCEITTSLDRPGFVRLEAHVVGAPDAVRFDGGAGVDFAGIVANQGEPSDFEGFWRHQLAGLARVPMDPEAVEITSPKAGVKLYRVRLGCVGGKPATGYLSVPEGEGPYVAQLVFYGYNESWSEGALNPPSAGIIAANSIQFRVNAHGLELGREASYYAAAREAVSFGANGHGWNPADNAAPETCYFLNMALRGVRAAEYVQTLPKWNGRDLYVTGGSQGALQSVLVASLCPKVSRADVNINWLCDLRGKAFGGRLASEFQPEYRPGLDYFDEVFHARRIGAACAVYVSQAGLGDYTSPPSGIACFYNALRCKKSITFKQNAEHGWTTSDPTTPTYAFSAPAREDPGPDVDWRDLSLGSCAAAEGFNFADERFDVEIDDLGAYGGTAARLKLTLTDARGTTTTADRPIGSEKSFSFDVPLRPGGSYSYALTVVDEGGQPLARHNLAAGEFLAGRREVSFYAHAATDEAAGGAWTEKPPVAGGRYRLASGAVFGIDDRRAGIVRTVSRLSTDGSYREADLPALRAELEDGGQRFGVALLDDGRNDVWALLLRTADGVDVKRLAGAENAEETFGEIEVVVETDTAASPALVSCQVGPVGGPYVRLSDADGRQWFELAAGSPAGVSALTYRGKASLASLDGERDDAAAYAVEGDTLSLRTNVRLDPSDLADGSYGVTDNGYRFRWRDTDAFMTYDAASGRAVVSRTPPANGLDGFASYVLDLEPADAKSVPVLDIENGGEGLFRLTLRNGGNGQVLAPRSVPGVSVAYELERSPELPFSATSVLKGSGPEFQVPGGGDKEFFRARAVVEEEW